MNRKSRQHTYISKRVRQSSAPKVESISNCCSKRLIVHRDLKPANLMLGGIPHETGTREMAAREVNPGSIIPKCVLVGALQVLCFIGRDLSERLKVGAAGSGGGAFSSPQMMRRAQGFTHLELELKIAQVMIRNIW